MKNKKTGLIFVSGAALGIALTLCLGAVSKDAPAKNNPPKELPQTAEKSSAPLQIVSYPNGATGFFNPENSTLYLYDANLRNCYLTRRITKLGEPLD
jgi:hypothetical protein